MSVPVDGMLRIQEIFQMLMDQSKFKSLNCHALTELETRVAVLMAYLSEEVAEARRVANNADSFYKFKYATNWKSSKETFIRKDIKFTIPDVDHTATILSNTEALAANDAECNAEKLSKTWESCEKVINALKDRIKVLMKEEIQASNMG